MPLHPNNAKALHWKGKVQRCRLGLPHLGRELCYGMGGRGGPAFLLLWPVGGCCWAGGGARSCLEKSGPAHPTLHSHAGNSSSSPWLLGEDQAAMELLKRALQLEPATQARHTVEHCMAQHLAWHQRRTHFGSSGSHGNSLVRPWQGCCEGGLCS